MIELSTELTKPPNELGGAYFIRHPHGCRLTQR